jgi:drug/metabolite transporter (DMT)-like permease
MKYIMLYGTIALIALGQILFKVSSGHASAGKWTFLFSPTFIAALVIYAFATLLWIFTLRLWPLTVAYAAQALTIVLVLGAGVIIFGETMSSVQYLGAAIILAGMAVLAVG